MKKIKLIQLFPILLLTALFLSAFGYTLGHPNDVNTSVQAQETATVGATEPPVLSTPISSTVIVPVTGEDNTANNNTTLLVYVLIGIAGLAFLVAVVAVLTRANQPPTDHTHTR